MITLQFSEANRGVSIRQAKTFHYKNLAEDTRFCYSPHNSIISENLLSFRRVFVIKFINKRQQFRYYLI